MYVNAGLQKVTGSKAESAGGVISEESIDRKTIVITKLCLVKDPA
jgi:hypothetical protein